MSASGQPSRGTGNARGAAAARVAPFLSTTRSLRGASSPRRCRPRRAPLRSCTSNWCRVKSPVQPVNPVAARAPAMCAGAAALAAPHHMPPRDAVPVPVPAQESLHGPRAGAVAEASPVSSCGALRRDLCVALERGVGGRRRGRCRITCPHGMPCPPCPCPRSGVFARSARGGRRRGITSVLVWRPAAGSVCGS